MSIVGKYQHYKNEDLEDYFTAIGVPFMGRKMMAVSSPLMEISIEGDVYKIASSSLFRTVENKFKLGEEYEEKMPNTTIMSVTTCPSDNELVTNSVIPHTNAKCGRHFKFTDTECVVTLTHENAKIPAKRYFRRIN